MEDTNLIEVALEKGDISTSLYQNSAEKALVTDLQRILFELGFRKELKWDAYQADGNYGDATTEAVAAFAAKNNFTSNGKSVSNALAKLILERHNFLPEMYLLWSINISDLRTKKYISRGTPTSITAIQILLNTLGYGRELNFSEYGADGKYGSGTNKALIKYARDNGIESDGDLLTRPLINLLIKNISVYYGGNWAALAENNLPSEKSPLVMYQGSRFSGKPCRADILFVPALEKVNAYAQAADVFVVVTSSFRTTTNVNGAIVKPATFSNHMAGHAIDMNVRYGNGMLASSQILAKYPNVPEPVKKFIGSIINDRGLRWGGQFNAKDPVHIDDHINKNLDEWQKRYQAMQQAVQLGKVV